MSNPIEVSSISGDQSPQSPPDESMPLSEGGANFIEFTVKVSREGLSINTLQHAIQAQFDTITTELNQYNVRVDKKVAVSDGEWAPKCGERIENINRASECLFNALYKAGLNENMACTLRKRIVEKALADLMAACQISDQGSSEQEIENIKQGIKSICDGLSPEEESQLKFCDKTLEQENIGHVKTVLGALNDTHINNATQYILAQNITDITAITNNHLKQIFVALGMSNNLELLSRMTDDGNKAFPDEIDDEEARKDVARGICLRLINIVDGETRRGLHEQPIDHNRLLNVIEAMNNAEQLPLGGSRALLNIMKDEKILKQIRDTYNKDWQGDPIVGNSRSSVFPKAKDAIFRALDLIAADSGGYVGSNSLKHIVDEIKRPVFLINADELYSPGGRKMHADNDIQGGVLYNLDGSEESFQEKNILLENGMLRITRGESLSEAKVVQLPEDCLTIIKISNHFHTHILNLRKKGRQERQLIDDNSGPSIDSSSGRGRSRPVFSEVLLSDYPAESNDVNHLAAIVASIQELFHTQQEEPFSSVQSELTRFQDQFIPYLQRAGKNQQVAAEIENLRHIRSCAEEMPNGDGLNFKPEFVARIVRERLRMAMFGAERLGDAEVGSISIGDISEEEEDKYQPSCMWDFGWDRNSILLEGEGYHWDGILASPRPEEEQPPADQQNNTKNRFSILRGCGEKGDYYAMPNGGITPSLGARFRQFLAFQSGMTDGHTSLTDDVEKLLTQIPNDFKSDESVEKIFEKVQQLLLTRDLNQEGNDVVKELLSITCDDILEPLIEKVKAKLPWLRLNENTPLDELPPSLMFPVGLQFGQNQVGSWNPFTLAAKKYFAYQFADESQNFFWPQEYQPSEEMDDVLRYSFEDLIAKIWPGREFDVAIAEQFEKAIVAYYAITQEILSRSKFPGNDQQGMHLEKVMRLEDMRAIEAMTFSGSEFQGAAISSNAERPVLVAGSVSAHVVSLDRTNDFPPPMRVITKYEQVHHAHIFGIHLFNVDFCNAVRVYGKVFDDERRVNDKPGKYTGGCPFFRERQRETLLIPHGLKAEICGVLASAENQDHAYVLANSDEYDDGLKEEIQLTDITSEKARHQIEFCKSSDKKNIDAILKDHHVEPSKPHTSSRSKPKDEDEYRPTQQKTRKKTKANGKYEQGSKAMENLTNIGSIVQGLNFDKIYRIIGGKHDK
jgi:hypothetical protein